jgi:glycosyltransferase involved in cell wall biosynthesis
MSSNSSANSQPRPPEINRERETQRLLQRPTVSVIVPVHNGGLNFRRCLESIMAATPPADEVIVVADGDTDGSWIAATGLGARVFRLPTQSGPARARNTGAREARSDILFFVDPEVIVPRNAMTIVASVFAQNLDVAAVFGSYDDSPVEGNFFSQYKNLFHYYVHQHAREEVSTFWSLCGAIRKSALFGVGGFDERYRESSVEDIELGHRLRKAGHKIRLCKALQVKNLKQWQPGNLIKPAFLSRLLPWTELLFHRRHFFHSLSLSSVGKTSVLLMHSFLGAVVSSLWWSEALAVAGGLLVLLLAVNIPFCWFFVEKRGLSFAFQAISWQFLYYGCCSFAFLLGLFFWRRKHTPAPTSLVLVPEGRPDSLRRPEWR